MVSIWDFMVYTYPVLQYRRKWRTVASLPTGLSGFGLISDEMVGGLYISFGRLSQCTWMWRSPSLRLVNVAVLPDIAVRVSYLRERPTPTVFVTGAVVKHQPYFSSIQNDN